MNDYIFDIIKSWKETKSCVNSTDKLLKWINELNSTTYVNIKECSINDGNMWFYDDYNGEVLNRKRSFFSIRGMRYFVDNEYILEQPIIVQPEIGYLGIICKKINGILHFLMQAKIEPGNVNCVQISPTIQATKSNFTRAHGGKMPLYFDWFEHSEKHYVIYDQIQSEQSARFYKKRNRNIIILIDEDEEIEMFPNFKWMTLGQIKTLMDYDNLVNMDTRTVLSGIPFILNQLSAEQKIKIKKMFSDKALFESMFNGNIQEQLPQIFRRLNNYKMFKEVRAVQVPLNQLAEWKIDEYGITCKKYANFMVRYYDIEISGREVQHWSQPLFKAIGAATFGLITQIQDGIRRFLVKIKPEIGSFDEVEVGPSIQWEPSHYLYNDNNVEQIFRQYVENNKGIMINVVLSEEGGRFFHEENKNIIIELDYDEKLNLADEYLWVDYSTLNYMIQFNNCLNIQLRNLLSLLKL